MFERWQLQMVCCPSGKRAQEAQAINDEVPSKIGPAVPFTACGPQEKWNEDNS